MPVKKIGVLTGGGDVPGLNSAIKEITEAGHVGNIKILGIRRGWEGLTHLNPDDPQSRQRYLVNLTRENTRTIDRMGGTCLHTSRTDPAKMKVVPDHLAASAFPKTETETGATYDMTSQVLKNIEYLKLDALISIGGNDTLGYSSVLCAQGAPVIAIPKTMENNVQNTEYCIGFVTAITRAIEAIQRQRTTVGSNEGIGVFRIFGRNAGHTALSASYVTSISCAIPEFKFNLDRMIDLLVEEKRDNPSGYSLVILSEGAEWDGYRASEYGEPDAYGHRKKTGVAEDFSDEVKKRAGVETTISDLTYDLRSGEAAFTDKLISCSFAHMAIESIMKNQFGLMTALARGCYAMMPIPYSGMGPRRVDVGAMYDTERYRPRYFEKTGLPVFLSHV